jgi:hypothetical protein
LARNWTIEQINEQKRLIKKETDSLGADHGLQARLKHTVEKVTSLEKDETNQGYLRRYIYAFSALYQHAHHGGLRESQVASLMRIVQDTLRLVCRKPEQSKLECLYGEFYLLRSQLCRRSGDQWQAAWEQQMSLRHVNKSDSAELARQVLADGIRNYRLGNGGDALALFHKARELPLQENQKILCKFWIVSLLRLRGEYSECETAIEDLRGHASLSTKERLDLDWEEHNLAVQRTGDASTLVEIVGSGKSHYDAAYFLEAFFWAHALSEHKPREKIPFVRSMARIRSLKAWDQGEFYRCALAVERCYDLVIPFEFRLTELGESLPHRHALPSANKELLFLAAAARWLAHNHIFNQATLVMHEYESLSGRLSEGKTRDSLCVLGDLFEKTWHRNPADRYLHEKSQK